MNDEHWMRRALRLAEKGRGRTSPNPMVGAVLVKNGKLIAEGFHAKAGGAHAEVVAIERARNEAADSTLYLNLEPCTHVGKTPPCAPLVVQAGIKRAVIGMKDPNPLVQGRGVEILQHSGIEVTLGVLEEECLRLNEAFSKYINNKEPFVILKVATTLDGRIATREGESKWISNEDSRRVVYRLRDGVDGVIVGIGTVLKDDPRLTARIPKGRDPYRVILDSSLRIPEDAQVLHEPFSKTIIAATEKVPVDKMERLHKRGVQVLQLDSDKGRVNLVSLLRHLGEMGMMSLLVEGGSQVNGSFLDQGLIDKILFFLGPKLLGDPQALGIFGGKGSSDLQRAVSLRDLRTKKIGEDLLVEGYVVKGVG
jgi:diaminohydroxyphosphoribosylaminopyrimidine deaminase/5-amino-6-(5-phosphoribosylamino)uracil reductase